MGKYTYKKRAKGNWNQGKGHKGDGDERQFSKKEIGEMVEEIEENHLVRYKSRRKRNRKASLEHTISWYKEKINEHKNAGRTKDYYIGYLITGLEAAEKEYKEKYAIKDKQDE